jgi:hypothetical protein
VSVESMMVKMAQDKCLPGELWASKPQSSRVRARQLAELAVGEVGQELAEYPKVKVLTVYGGGTFYRGVVYAGRRSRRDAAKGKR